jgi:exopolyphosphatase / guanosine-5'-triphosphate,3'-diphosphate pyrophosphatase
MKKASIDIGTNSVLLLVAEMVDDQIKVLHEKQRIPRLGKNVDNSKNLHSDSIIRVLDVLKKYKNWLHDRYPEVMDRVVVTATSAVRDASNREEFLRKVKNITGWNVRLLSGREEAETTFRGALSVLHGRDKRNNIVLDIGGGSTEIAYGTGFTLEDAFSIDMGSVRFTERFFKKDPPHKQSIKNLRTEVKQLLSRNHLSFVNTEPIGVAGTVTSIAAIKKGLARYDATELNGLRLKKEEIEKFIQEFSSISTVNIEKKYPSFLKGRGDVILSGILILSEFLEWCNNDTIIVSTGGIRHGILIA